MSNFGTKVKKDNLNQLLYIMIFIFNHHGKTDMHI